MILKTSMPTSFSLIHLQKGGPAVTVSLTKLPITSAFTMHHVLMYLIFVQPLLPGEENELAGPATAPPDPESKEQGWGRSTE